MTALLVRLLVDQSCPFPCPIRVPPGFRPKGGVLLDIPNRDSRLPQFHVLKHHSKIKPYMKARRILLYLQDTSPKAMEEYYQYVSEMNFPEGTAEGIKAAGMSLSVSPTTLFECPHLTRLLDSGTRRLYPLS